MPRPRDLYVPGCRDARGYVSRDFYGNNGVLRSVQDQRRNAHCRKDMADVDLFVHPVEGLERSRTRRESQHAEKGLSLLIFESSESVDRFHRLRPWAEDLQVA